VQAEVERYPYHDKSMDATKAARFALAREALGSRVERVLL